MPSSITGTITGAAQTVVLSNLKSSGDTAIAVNIQGTYSNIELIFEASVDNVTYFSYPLSLEGKDVLYTTILTNQIKSYTNEISPNINYFRVRSLSHSSGTMNVTISSSGFASLNISNEAGNVLFVSNQKIEFEHDFTFGDNGLLWYSSTATGATFTFPSNAASCQLNITSTNGSTAIKQSKRILHRIGSYTLGIVAARMGALKTNTRQRIGLFDSNDGIFFEQDGSNFKAVHRTFTSGSAVDTTVVQSDFNIDKFDGTGPSGFTLQTSNTNCYGFRWCWSSGMAQLGIFYNGIFYVGHQFSFNNTILLPITAIPNLPFRCELQATSTVGSTTNMSLFGVVAYSDGDQYKYIRRTVDFGTTGRTTPSSLSPIISIRLKSSASKSLLILDKAEVVSSSSTQATYWTIVLNGTLTGASFADVPGTNTISQYDTSATSISGGDTIYSDYAAYYGNNQQLSQDIVSINNLIRLSSNISGTSDILTLCMARVSGSSYTSYPVVIFKELF